ncbi:hypothetical protein E2C01_013783 [Portunus trituberculatus]|uniref:Uncharacterized protein n=1 Tax=Portunus trituberculatus TaxID=210409 RepID=A0A5B7DH57_PORTR|nr:hypothetical protein [Portunus trituberculatus]
MASYDFACWRHNPHLTLPPGIFLPKPHTVTTSPIATQLSLSTSCSSLPAHLPSKLPRLPSNQANTTAPPASSEV